MGASIDPTPSGRCGSTRDRRDAVARGARRRCGTASSDPGQGFARMTVTRVDTWEKAVDCGRAGCGIISATLTTGPTLHVYRVEPGSPKPLGQ